MSTSVTLTPPASASLGINYYHESMGYIGRTNAQITQDLQTIAGVCKNIKVYFNPLPSNAGTVSRSTALTNVQNIISIAKSLGFYVVWVENIDQGKVLTDSTTDLSNSASYKWKWADYSTQVVADAALAQAAGADEFLVGNEIIGSTHFYSTDPGTSVATTIYTTANFPGSVGTLVSSCRANFSGKIGLQEVNTITAMWAPSGVANLHGLDKIYWDLYEKYKNFQQKADSITSIFGTTAAAIGEMSSIDVLGKIGNYVAYTENDWSRELMRRYDYLRQKGLTTYGFTYGDPSSTSTGFGLRKNTSDNQTFHDIWQYLLLNKNITYTEYFLDTFPPNDFTGGSGGTGGALTINATNTLATITVPATDYVFRGRVQWQGSTGSTRIIARYTDANNYYCINIDVTNNKATFLRRQAGVETQLGATVPWPPSGSFSGSFSGSTFTDFDFEIRVQGLGSATQVSAYIDTYKIADQTDSGNSSLNSAQCGVLYVSTTTVINTVHVTAIESYNVINPTGNISVSASSISFTATAGGSNPASQTDTLTNNTVSSGSYSSSIVYGTGQTGGWLSISPTSAALGASGGSQSVTFTATTGSLTTGTYTATVVFALAGNTATVNVTFNITAAGSGSTTPLTVYFAAAASATSNTGNQLYTISGNPSVTWKYSRVGLATGFGEVTSQGTTNAWAAGTALGTPTGKGFFLDGSTLYNQSMSAATWTGSVRLNCAQGGDLAPQQGSLTADIYVRVYKYSSGTYTLIATLSALSQSLTFAFTNYSVSGSGVAVSFGSSDQLYIDIWANVTANANASSVQDIRLNGLSTDTTGFTGNSNMSVVTPGYGTTPGGGSTGGGTTGGTSTGTGTVVLTNAGHNLLRDGLSGAVNPLIRYVALGSSTTTPTASDTTLGNETFRKAVTSFVNGSTGQIYVNMFLSPGDAIGYDVEEIGFFGGTTATSAANSGVLLARGLYSHTKSSTESIQFQLNLTL